MSTDRSALIELCQRLERDYQPRFATIGGSFNVWANSRDVGAEVMFGGRVGPIWSTAVRYRRRRGPLGLVGPFEFVMTLEQAEAAVREQLDERLATGKADSGQA